MNDDRVHNLFKSLIATPDSTLKAHDSLKQSLQADSSLLPLILQHLSNPQDSSAGGQLQHFHIVTVLHPALIEVFLQLPSDTQDVQVWEQRKSVLGCFQRWLRRVPTYAQQVLQLDGVDPWVQPLGELMRWASADELPSMLSGIQFFSSLLIQTPYTRSNCEVALHKLAPVLLERLFAVFASPQLEERWRTKLLWLVLQVVKSFSPLDGADDAAVRACFDGTFDLWMSLFVSALQGTLSLNLPIKKYILKILVVIFRDMQSYLKIRRYYQPAHLLAVWDFSYRLLPLYLWVSVWQQSPALFPPHPAPETDQDYLYDDDSDALCSTVEGLAQCSLEFLSVLLSVPQLQNGLRVSVHHLTNALFHYLLLSDQQVSGWKNNPLHFSTQSGSLEYQSGVRGRALSMLNELIEKYGDLAIQAILVASQKFLLNLPQSASLATFALVLKAVAEDQPLLQASAGLFQSEGQLLSLAKISGVDIRTELGVSGETWRKVEAGLLVLGRFSEDVIVFQSKQSGAFDIQAFVRGIVRQIHQQDYYSMLKGQSLYCLTRFSQIISIKYRGLFTQLFGAALVCNLQNAPLSLRLIACKAASAFLKKIEKHKLQLGSETIALALEVQPIQRVCEIPLLPQTTPTVIQVLMELGKNKQLVQLKRPQPDFYLSLFHQCLVQQSLVNSFVGLLETATQDYTSFAALARVFACFAGECLKLYSRQIVSPQRRSIKAADTQLILTAMRMAGVFIQKSISHPQSGPEREKLLEALPSAIQIMEVNQDVPLQVALSLFVKGLLRAAEEQLRAKKEMGQLATRAVQVLLRVPKDKSQESGSVYAGNLAILLFQRVLGRNHNEILQEVVLKVFRSRTPSVIQSLVLVYARLINQGATPDNKFNITGEAETRAKAVVDFLASFSIQNRMGLKILVDKWLLQQSLFRGKYTKIATFMALSRLFLLNDKRVDNLLVIGFNPSHTNINNDVNAPLKILATLIRCLDNELGSKGGQEDDDEEEIQEGKEEGLTVELQKFRQDRQEQQVMSGGLADRQNQQGSTCYMSAMLQFYDDGEECDDKTEEDLIFLKDTSTQFQLSEYLMEFFRFVIGQRGQYFKECLKGLLRQDVRTLQKYIKF